MKIIERDIENIYCNTSLFSPREARLTQKHTPMRKKPEVLNDLTLPYILREIFRYGA